MWTRSELKQNAWAVLKNGYWECVVAFLIVGALSGGAGFLSAVVPFWGTFAGIIFLSLPLTVGLNFYFMQNQIAPSALQNVFFPFMGGRYMKIVGAMAWMYLFLFLWSLIPSAGIVVVLVRCISALIPYNLTGWPLPFNFHIDISWLPVLIPGGVIFIAGMVVVYIKAISYSMTSFILTDNPLISYGRALKLSVAMTYGHKWAMFVLYLSFLGWGLLALLTAGLGFIFLAPYVKATEAQLYARLRDNAIHSGLATAQELNVFPKY